MQTRPPEVPDDLVESAATEHWGLPRGTATYLPVGHGSHHWLLEAAPDRWFASLDVLSSTEPTASFDRLAAALGAAFAARESGLGFVVAPLPSRDGRVVVPLSGRHALALYPWLDGQARSFADELDDPTAGEVTRMLAALHGVPSDRLTTAGREGFGLPGREVVESALDEAGRGVRWPGVYGDALGRLLAEQGDPIRRALDRQDRLLLAAGSQRERFVLTHGEPHPGNLLRTTHGLRLVDWDTALLAPPERDVWLLDARTRGRGAAAYSALTGHTLSPQLLEWYRLRWALVDVALFVELLRDADVETADTTWSWPALQETVTDLDALGPR